VPHELCRTFVSAALDSGPDIAVVRKIAGHAGPGTTARHDRRPEQAKRAAAGMIRVSVAAANRLLTNNLPVVDEGRNRGKLPMKRLDRDAK